MTKMHNELLPFSEQDLGKYFDRSVVSEKELQNNAEAINKNRDAQLAYFQKSIDNYKDYCKEPVKYSDKITKMRQAEKDERFFTARAFVGMFESPNKLELVKQMLEHAFGIYPPEGIGFKTWDDALIEGESEEEKVTLILEKQISSPKIYREYLSKNIKNRHLVPYIFERAKKKDSSEFRENLEGATHVDAYIFNPKTKFRVFIEAKYLSDISYDVSYDMARNQIARNIDCMLDDSEYKSLFMLVTPQFFIDNPRTRLYGFKMTEYKADGELLQLDLPHRALDKETKLNLPKQLAWVSWEELENFCKSKITITTTEL